MIVEYAKEKFTNSKITYLNTRHATKQRRFYDANISDQYLNHWCNPGSNMIPTFQLQTYLHLISLGLS